MDVGCYRQSWRVWFASTVSCSGSSTFALISDAARSKAADIAMRVAHSKAWSADRAPP